MIVLVSTLLAYAVGFGVLRRLLTGVNVPYKSILALSLSGPVGLGMISCFIFIAFLISPAQSREILFAFLGFTMALIVFDGARNKTFTRLVQKTIENIKDFNRQVVQSFQSEGVGIYVVVPFFFAVFLYQFGFYVWEFIQDSLYRPHGMGDSLFFWNMKANCLFRLPHESWVTMFEPNIEANSYPLLIPGSVAFGSIVAGAEVAIWSAVVAFIFICSLLLFVFWYLSSYASFFLACLMCCMVMGVNNLCLYATGQYADVPLAFFVMAATAITVVALRSGETKLFFMAGLLAAFGGWTKNDGVLFMAVLGGCLFVLLMFAKIEKKTALRYLLQFALGLTVVFWAYVYLQVVYVTGNDNVAVKGEGAGAVVSMLTDNREVSKKLASRIFDLLTSSNYKYILYFSVSSFLFGFLANRKDFLRSYVWLFFVVGILVNMGYFVVLHFTKFDIDLRIQVSLNRLLLHALPLLLLFCMESIHVPRLFEMRMFR